MFLFLHFYSPVLTRDRQDNRNYREIKFSTTSFPVCPRRLAISKLPIRVLRLGGVTLHMQHKCTPLDAGACRPYVWPVQCVTCILCLVLWPHVTADWRLGAAVLSSMISQAKLLRYMETGGMVPGDTHPAIRCHSPQTLTVYCLSVQPAVNIQPPH